VTSPAEALDSLVRAWPHYVAECRSVLASELHYQALLYHCLRVHGKVPPEQLGMNVKVWIAGVVSEDFRRRDLRKAERFGGGFELIPDVVIFGPEIGGDFRRRNRENTLRRMLLAVEVKASEKERKRLGRGEIVGDVVKLEALGIEVRHRDSDVLGAVVAVDTAPEAGERMTPEARRAADAAAASRDYS